MHVRRRGTPTKSRSGPRPRARLGALASALSLSLLVGTVATGPAPARAADVTEGLLLHYSLQGDTGGVAVDSSGNGRNGTLHGTAVEAPGQGLAFNGSNTYVRMPNDVMAGLSSISVSADVLINTGQATPYFIWGMGNSSGAYGNGYLFTTGNDYRTTIATGNWSTEQTTRPSPSRNLTRGVWKHIAYTLSGGVGVIYENGLEVGRNTNVTITPGGIGNGVTTANYIGRSLYSGDRYFNGRLRDFRVYDRALAPREVAQLASAVTSRAVALDKAALDLGPLWDLENDLPLPTSGANGSAITWSTSNAAVITSSGRVTRPAVGAGNVRAVLTATLTSGGVSDTRSFEVRVLAEFSDADKAQRDAAALVVNNADDVRGNLTLPTSGKHGSRVSWRSANASIVSADGIVRRPAARDQAVELTATVTNGSATETVKVTAKVRKRPLQAPLKGYTFPYFTGEGTANGEQIYFALSQGNDPLRWRELDGGQPVITSQVGEKGLRDPFIIRSPEGDKFYMIATDLKIYGNGDWTRAQAQGSRYIEVWESTDLVSWSEQRHVLVSPKEAGNTWAPEAYYDDALGAYVVFWASKIYAADDPNHTGSQYQKMMYATTRDFHTFSEPEVWYDPGYAVIDSTVIKNGDTYYRFTKDERGRSTAAPCGKFPFQQKADSVLSRNWGMIKTCIGQGVVSQAEGPTVFKSNTEDKWYLFIDENGGRGYVPFETTDLESGSWRLSTSYQLPARPRHGTVLPVTQAEYDRLSALAPQACTTSLSGRVSGPLTLASGVTCLSGADVRGAVKVGPGASLVANGSSIRGSLVAEGARVVALTDTAVNGTVAVTGTTRMLRLVDAEVAGQVRVDGTTSSLPPDLSGTAVKGKLRCDGNATPPTLTGTTATGRGHGQCADV
ncbi:immunoglobulin-like domain-containing protein [Motilibacter aurantiacus]|uniref:immunoglobulin-like domain-containing protein n=1 Tax=Motilibacter aurantiacus TaxID=2714955 RepID=UPI00140D9C0F|nr:immunoglobulin-like domain-containing protein [Motilibacter aurantiacus]NHC45348.1 family 43 glycosylhydrolase [Motilibacter aurantiacus]